jgi:DNA-binding MarR family transcriptional regulator
MQLLTDASTPGTVELAARELLDTAPLIMRIIRQNMRRHRSGLTVPQFRTLCYASTYEGCSLSAVADFIGLSLPAMSRLVDGLVDKRLMKRRTCDDDRRHVRLTVTPAGQTTITEARRLAQDRLAKVLAAMPPEQRGALVTTMQILRDLFAPEVADGDDNAIGEDEDADRSVNVGRN